MPCSGCRVPFRVSSSARLLLASCQGAPAERHACLATSCCALFRGTELASACSTYLRGQLQVELPDQLCNSCWYIHARQLLACVTAMPRASPSVAAQANSCSACTRQGTAEPKQFLIPTPKGLYRRTCHRHTAIRRSQPACSAAPIQQAAKAAAKETSN